VAELLRLLAGHPALTVEGVAAHSRAGDEVDSVQPHLAGSFGAFLPAAEVAAQEVDLCFSCLPAKTLDADEVRAHTVVDLADDHRWSQGWVYGLTEFARDLLPGATRIANPGCYPTASLLALVPFLRAGVIDGPVTIDALSGISGAGREGKDHLLYASAEGSASAYGTTTHRHIPEIETSLSVWGGKETTVSFTPHLVPMTRGVLVTARAPLTTKLDDEKAIDILRDAYEKETFIEVLDAWPQTKALSGTNRAHIHARVDERAGLLICSTAIDNLGKGAAGQAIQNANVALGIEEDAGLGALGVWP
jgi:N-acetyl-gamma-glutamyl-phosphate reductase